MSGFRRISLRSPIEPSTLALVCALAFTGAGAGGCSNDLPDGTKIVPEIDLTDPTLLETAEVAFSVGTSSAGEGDASAGIAVTLDRALVEPATIDYAVTAGTATGTDDYVLASGTLTFAPGETSKSIDVTIVDDALDEDDETVVVALANPSSSIELGAISSHAFSIVDDDASPVVEFSLAASNGDEGSSPAALEVTLSAASGRAVTVGYAASGGTASGAGTDFTLAAGTLTFNPGVTTRSISLAIIDDAMDEPAETVDVTLSSPSNATAGATLTHSYTIDDDDAAPSVGFAAASSQGAESAAAPSIQVSLSAASAFPVTVDYAVSGGTATGGGSDYTLAAGTLTFSPGVTSQSVPLTVVDDASVEGGETVALSLSNPSNASLGAQSSHTFTITDDDNLVAFAQASSGGAESVTPALIEVTLATPSSLTITVDYAVSGGTASGSGTDYTLAAGTLTFAPGDASETISLAIANDTIDENDETVQVALSNPANAAVGATSTHTYTIGDDDLPPSVSFALGSSAAAESTASPSLAVSLSAPSGKTVTVDYAVSGGTATGGGTDYTLASGTLSFAPGETSKAIAPSVVEDVLAEADETIEVTLSNPSNATAGATLTHAFTIQDNDPMPQVAFTLSSSSGAESSGASLSVELSAPSGHAITVDYAVSGGTATGGGTDYTLASGTLSFAAGETSKSIAVAVTGDALDEDDETVSVTLSNPVNAGLGSTTSHAYTITDDDLPPSVAFTLSSSSGLESVASVNLAVSLSAASAKPITVDYAASGGSAASPADYSISGTQLSFAPGVTSLNVPITVVDDAAVESDETIGVTLSSPSNASLGAQSSHTYTITENDAAIALTGAVMPANGTYGANGQIEFQFTWAQAVNVTGTPRLALTLGAAAVHATYVSGTGTQTLNFRYTVQAGNTDSDGIAAASSLDLNGGTISGAAGNADLAVSAVMGSLAQVLVNTSITPPDQVTNVASAPTTSSTSLSVSWSVPANNGTPITHYVLQYRELGQSTWTTRSPNPSSNSAVVSGLTAGVTYEIRVAASNGALGPYSAVHQARIFNVMSLSPIAWLDATDVAGNGSTPANGSKVATWVDKTGAAQNATETVAANQPTFQTNIQNGLPAVRFADHDRGLQGSFTRSNGTQLTIFIVGQYDSAYSDRCAFEFIGGGGTARAFFIDRRYAANTFYSPALTKGSFHLWTITNSGTSATVTEDGSTVIFNGTTDFNTNFTGTGTYYLGDDSTGGNRMFGYIGEILIFDTSLSGQDFDDLENYLMTKWGL